MRYLVAGLNILENYSPDAEVSAEHDVIRVHVSKVSDDDKELLEGYGWFFDTDHNAWCKYV